MLIKYKDAAYNNKIEDLRNNGYTVNFVAFDYDDFVMEEGNPVPFIELQLPNGGKSYKDYTAIVAWSDYLENDNPDEERTHSGMPVPGSFTVQDGDTTVNCYFVLEDTATEGVVRFSFAATSQGPFSNEDFSDFVGNVDGLMFIEGHEYALDPDTSLVVPNLEAFFAQASGTADFQLDIANKTKLLSLGDNEAFSAYRYYKIIPSIPHGESSVIEFDGTSYHTENSSYQLLPLPIDGILNLRGYTEDELETTDVAEIYQTAEENSSIFEDTVTNEAFGCLHLERPLIYPISRPLTLRSNIRIVGNGSTIMAYNMVNNSGTYVAEKMNFIETAEDSSSVSNVTFVNLTFKGRFDGSDNCVEDQCIKTHVEYPMLKNLKFENVIFTGFIYGIHPTSLNKNRPFESSCWSFNNCEFTECATPVMLSYIDDVSFTNCHFSASLSKRETEHCIYISGGTSHIVVDNCLLENAMGAGIVNSCASNALKENETVDNPSEDRIETAELMMRNNRFTNNQIRNCNMGIIIGNPSEYILIENIFVTNVSRALVLQNCTNVVVNNFNASGCSYYEYIRMDTEGDTHWGSEPNDWFALAIRGYVQAKITNSFFSTGGLMFTCSESYFPTDGLGEKIIVDIDFENCVFLTTFSEYLERIEEGVHTGEYQQPTCFLGLPGNSKYDPSQYFYYDIDFTRCQFHMNSENNEKSMITLRGYLPKENDENAENKASQYRFDNCLITYRDGNGNPNDDVPEYDSNGDLIDAMPQSYFISPNRGTHADVTSCTFYCNRDVYPDDSEQGFVKKSFLERHMTCSVDELTRYDQKLVITDNDAS